MTATLPAALVDVDVEVDVIVNLDGDGNGDGDESPTMDTRSPPGRARLIENREVGPS